MINNISHGFSGSHLVIAADPWAGGRVKSCTKFLAKRLDECFRNVSFGFVA